MKNEKNRILNVAVVCEESQTVCKAFRELGHNAYSCDLLSCSGGHPEWHFNCDCFEIIENKGGVLQNGETIYVENWDLMIAHPPCTYLTVTGNRWFNEERYGDAARKRKLDRGDAVKFFVSLAEANVEHICIENPVGIMSTIWRKPDQIIQPWMFGDKAQKTTCLWTKNLPNLIPTKIVDKGEMVVLPSGKSMPKWYADAWGKCKTKEERSTARSKTFSGIAEAMANQYSRYLIERI